MSSNAGGFESFLDDLIPFFHGRRLTYVDIGCYTGEVCAKVLSSRLAVREVHLVEPNLKSLETARRRLSQHFEGQAVRFYPTAMGAAPGRIWMSAAKDMTKVLSDGSSHAGGTEALANVFEAPCSTLDELAEQTTDRRISLLKIDVEGYELKVLAGGDQLLRDQRADVVYIEAGMNPAGTQQCYYRAIEDALREHGYSLFRIYEQKHEWMDDSPLLRRVNLAFMSQAFVDRNPYRLSIELGEANATIASLKAYQTRADALAEQLQAATAAQQELRQQLQALTTEQQDLRQRLQAAATEQQDLRQRLQSSATAQLDLRQQLQVSTDEKVALHGQIRQLADQLKSQAAELAAAFRDKQVALDRRALSEAELAESKASTHRLQSELSVTSQRVGWLEGKRNDLQETIVALMSAVGDMHRRDLARRGDLASARRELAQLVQARPHRVGQAMTRGTQSLGGWARMPLAVWRAWRAAPLVKAQPDDILSFDNGKTALTLPLSVKPQTVLLPPAEANHEVWVHLLAAGDDAQIGVEMSTVANGSGAQELSIEGCAGEKIGTKPRVLSLRAGGPIRLFRRPTAAHAVALSVRRARGELCILRFELRVPGPATSQEDSRPRDRDDSTAYSSEELEFKLWGGYAAEALAALESRKNLRKISASEREDAAWSIARWHYVEGDYQQSLDNLVFIKTLVKKPHRRTAMAEAQCLLHLGRPQAAVECLEVAERVSPEKWNDYRLLHSTAVRELALKQGQSVDDAERPQLAMFNEVMARGDIAPLAKLDPSQPLSLANVTAHAKPGPGAQDHKVSVVIPAFNAQESIAWVIDGLLRQTWRNLEIIVVDDLSTDLTCDEVRAIAARDQRVRLLAKPVNEGAYPTRNAGVRVSTGDYITVHDSDDWSHPQKIEMQVRALEAKPERAAVITHWVRVAEHLEVVGPWVPRGSLFDVNFSSLLFKREVYERMGSWDTVKISGDAEYFYRLRALYGPDCVIKLPSRHLLSLSLTRDDSLTRSKATHLRSLFYGLRWNYRDAYLSWSSRLAQGDDAQLVDAKSGGRKFPVPMGCRSVKPIDSRYGLIVVADFAEDDASCRTALTWLMDAHRQGRRVAAFHWRKFERRSRAPLQASFYDVAMRHDVDILSPGDDVEAEVLVLADAFLAMHRIDPAPRISTPKIVAMIFDSANGSAEVQDVLGLATIDRTVEGMFGRVPAWLPMSARTAAWLASDPTASRRVVRTASVGDIANDSLVPAP
jgi:FkbM family methyltransferase